MNQLLLTVRPFSANYALQSTVSQIVDGLFSVLVTLGVVPIIRCPKGGAAEHVAAALEGKLRDHLKARSNLFSEGASALAATLSRPLLVLLDRNFDLSVMLQHCWSYKPLVQVRRWELCVQDLNLMLADHCVVRIVTRAWCEGAGGAVASDCIEAKEQRGQAGLPCCSGPGTKLDH
jgi:hypothetical protein